MCLALFCAVAATAQATIITITSTADTGPGTLRQALAGVANGDIIVFSVPLPATITLTNGELLVTNDLTISGPGATNLAISGNTNSRIFNIATNRTVSLSGLTICDGRTASGANGGGIYTAGTLALSNCVVGFNSAGDGSSGPNPGGFGGGIFNFGSLTAVACTFRSNTGGVGNVSTYGISRHGELTLLVSAGAEREPNSDVGTTAPLDALVSSDGKYFYEQFTAIGTIGAYRIGDDGSLTSIPGGDGMGLPPVGSQGLDGF